VSNTTSWLTMTETDGSVASLQVTGPSGTPTAIRLTGVCYSPAPIGASSDYAPNIGDFFWDTFKNGDFTVNGWNPLWARDLGEIRRLGANCIRIYSCLSNHLFDNGNIPDPDSSDFKDRFRNHQTLLDMCWNQGNAPLYVLVGLPLPSCMFWKEQYDDAANSAKVKFWNVVYKNTAQQMGGHPAVMGFTIFNELADEAHSIQQLDKDGKVTNADKVEFFWSQVQNIAKQVKSAAPTKLVGFGLHDNPNFTSDRCAKFLETLTYIDFYGVNTYQPQNFDSVFGPSEDNNKNKRVGYRNLPRKALKPVIITEWGMPATMHSQSQDATTVVDTTDSIQKTANVIKTVVPKIFAEKLCLGLLYFEYCDEWWKQPISFAIIKYLVKGYPSYEGWVDNIPQSQRIDDRVFPSIYWQYGGQWVGPGSFPNGWADEAGFGLYSVRRGPKVPAINTPYGPAVGNSIGPATVDIHVERVAMTTSLRECYAAVRAVVA
jgi:hypothetical protein